METDFDVAVVGLGPAGLAFLKAVSGRPHRLRIVALEKGEFPRDKACGDALTSLSLRILRETFPELAAVIAAHRATRTFTIRYPEGTSIRRQSLEFGLFPRRELDRLLFGSIPRDAARILQATRVEAVDLDGPVARLTCGGAGGATTLRAGLVLFADGSQSVRFRMPGAVPEPSRIVAVRQYWKGLPPGDAGFEFLVDDDGAGYFWIFPFHVDGEIHANVGYGSHHHDVRARYARILESPAARAALGAARPDSAPRGFPLNLATTRWGRPVLACPVAGPRHLLLGDAAGLVHPSTGEGISGALESGRVAAELLTSGFAGPELGRAYESRMLRHLRRNYDWRVSFLLFEARGRLPRFLRPAFSRLLHALV